MVKSAVRQSDSKGSDFKSSQTEIDKDIQDELKESPLRFIKNDADEIIKMVKSAIRPPPGKPDLNALVGDLNAALRRYECLCSIHDTLKRMGKNDKTADCMKKINYHVRHLETLLNEDDFSFHQILCKSRQAIQVIRQDIDLLNGWKRFPDQVGGKETAALLKDAENPKKTLATKILPPLYKKNFGRELRKPTFRTNNASGKGAGKYGSAALFILMVFLKMDIAPISVDTLDGYFKRNQDSKPSKKKRKTRR